MNLLLEVAAIMDAMDAVEVVLVVALAVALVLPVIVVAVTELALKGVQEVATKDVAMDAQHLAKLDVKEPVIKNVRVIAGERVKAHVARIAQQIVETSLQDN